LALVKKRLHDSGKPELGDLIHIPELI